MANLQNVIYLSNADYETLVTTGTVVINGTTLTYNENNLYITPDVDYQFTGGTNEFTVTFPDGSTQTVTVGSTIERNVTKSNAAVTSGRLVAWNAAADAGADGVIKDAGASITTVAPSTSSNADTTVPTSKAVWSAITTRVPDGSKLTDTTYSFNTTAQTNKIQYKATGESNWTDVPINISITNNITGSGTSGYLTKFNGNNTITNGPQLSNAVSSQSQTTKFLREDGTWAAPSYSTDTNTTYTLSGALSSNTFVTTLTPSSGAATTATVPAMTAATASAAGKAGLVPAPGSGKTEQFLRGDGTWGNPKEAYLEWGGRNFSGTYGCIDAAMVGELGANRLMFAKAAGITIEYTRDGGATWTDYGATDTQKVGLFSTGQNFVIGKADSTNKATANGTNYQLRVTLNTGTASIYTALNKFVIYISTSGSSDCTVTIQRALQNTPEAYSNIATDVPITGWSGYNVINVTSTTTYGNNAASQYGRIRFLFKANGGSTSYIGLTITKIMGFGGVGWTTPSTMAKTGHLYSFDASQNATFPAKVTATSFTGSLTGNADTATKLATGRTFKVNLASTSASTAFDGSANITDIGVSGALPVANGGTGATTAAAARTNLGLGNVTNDAQIPKAIGTTKGDIIYWEGSGSPKRLGIGTAGYFLKATADGPAYAALTATEITTALGYTPPQTDTTYTTLTQGNLDAGTSTTGELITAKLLYDNIHRYAIAGWNASASSKHPNTDSTTTKADYCWFKVAERTGITSTSSDTEIVFHVYDTMTASSTTAKSGILHARFRTDNTISKPYITALQWEYNNGYDLDDFIIACSPNENATSATVELWTRWTVGWTARIFTVLREGTRADGYDNVWTLFKNWNKNGQTAITAGYSQKASVLLSLRNNAATATTASKLSNTSAIGGTDLPVYFTAGGIPAAVSEINISGTGTTSQKISVTNDNGAVALLASTNRGLYDYTTGKTGWIIEKHNDSDNVYIPKWASIGSSSTPVYFTADGQPATVNTADLQAGKDGAGNTITAKYVTLDTAQTISGVKTFSSVVKATHADGVEARRFQITDESNTQKAYWRYNGTNNSVDLIFN